MFRILIDSLRMRRIIIRTKAALHDDESDETRRILKRGPYVKSIVFLGRISEEYVRRAARDARLKNALSADNENPDGAADSPDIQEEITEEELAKILRQALLSWVLWREAEREEEDEQEGEDEDDPSAEIIEILLAEKFPK